MSANFPGGVRRRFAPEVGPVVVCVALVVVSWLLLVALPQLFQTWALVPQAVRYGQVWRLVTWPLANPVTVFAVLNLFFFYLFGTELEQQLGARRMGWLLGGIWACLTVVTMAFGLGTGIGSLLGFGQIEFLVFLLWIMEYPRRPFFFGIPAWVVGAVLVGVNVLQMLQARDVVGVGILVASLVLVAMVAKQLGLLTDYAWIPGSARRSTGGPGSRKIRKAQAQARKQADLRAQDDARLDQLLDKISASGLDSLTSGERRELMRLRNRRS